MKQIMLAAFFMSTMFIANAQTTPAPIRSIAVNGMAEMEVVPDEIYVQVELSEYKKNNVKVDIEKIRTAFLATLGLLGYTDKDIAVQGYSGWDGNPFIYRKKKNNDLLAGIHYWVKVASTAKMNELVDRLDDASTTNFFIAKTSHSKITEYKKQLKIAAIKAARLKAEYLSEAIEEKIGKAITISEPDEVKLYQPQFANAMFKNNSAEERQATLSADFNKIKLQFEVNVVFALQ